MKKYSEYCNNYKYKIGDNILTENSSKNFIFYSNNPLNNYYFTLSNLKLISKSDLKYSRRIAINYNGEDVLFNISDIHFEVDFELLGVNQYNIFLTLFHHIKENMISDKNIFYIVCLNFQEIKLELMNIFYSFMNNVKIKFIILTKNISFICENIFHSSLIKKIKGDIINKSSSQEQHVNNIVKIITSEKISLFSLREDIYTFLTLNYNIHDCFSSIIFKLVEINYVNESNINNVLKKYNDFTEKYNNNYRPIYHLESFILFLINLKNKQES